MLPQKKKDLAWSLESKPRDYSKLKRIIPFLVIVGVVIIAIIVLNLNKGSQINTLNSIETESFDKFKQSLEKIVDLDTSVQPTVVELTDVETLKRDNPVLYDQAREGDIMLYYPNKIVIFRPSINKIVNVFPVTNNR